MDFSAYTEKDIKQFNGKLKGLPRVMPTGIGRLILYIMLMPLVMTFYILFVAIFTGIWKPLGAVGLAMLIPTAIFIWKFLGKQMRSGFDYSIRMALFAERNGFKYHYQGPPYDFKGTTGSILGNPMTSNLVRGSLEKIPFELFTTYGKGFYVVLKVALPNKYPQILLDTKSNNFIFSNLLSSFPDSKEIVLEGDFNKYFRVFSAGSKVETLQILSPELMARMLDYPRQADIEIVEDNLQIVLNYKTLKEEDIRMLFASAEQILKDIGIKSNNSRVNFDTKDRIK